jgi:uncharacterized protein (DUF2147 family)
VAQGAERSRDRQAKARQKNADAAKRSRAMIGVPIVLSMTPNGPGKWSGEVYNAGDGKTAVASPSATPMRSA